MSEPDPHLLFVYGTLMPHARSRMGRGERRRLRSASIDLGAAMVSGLICDRGSYPAMFERASGAAARKVQGRLLQLRSPDTVFKWLDVYEGADPRRGMPEYVRVVRPVTCHALKRDAVDAWMYVSMAVRPPGPIIGSGRFLR